MVKVWKFPNSFRSARRASFRLGNNKYRSYGLSYGEYKHKMNQYGADYFQTGLNNKRNRRIYSSNRGKPRSMRKKFYTFSVYRSQGWIP